MHTMGRVAVTKVCEVCAAEFTAQRSTRRYCSEAHRQRAKRDRELAAEADESAERLGLWRHARCWWCDGPLFPDKPERDNERLAAIALAHKTMGNIRKYCSPEHRNAARRYRYRVARLTGTPYRDVTRYRVTQADEDSSYRVTDPTGDPYALTEPMPCWRSAEWHEMARLVLILMEQGFVLDHPEEGFVDLARVREFAARPPDEDAAQAS